MAKIINPSVKAFTLPTGHEVPRLGELVTTNEVLRMVDNERALSGRILSGELSVEFDPDPPFEGVYASTSLEPPPVPPPLPEPAAPSEPAPTEPSAGDPPAEPTGDTPANP